MIRVKMDNNEVSMTQFSISREAETLEGDQVMEFM